LQVRPAAAITWGRGDVVPLLETNVKGRNHV